jgi:hypothetical protein
MLGAAGLAGVAALSKFASPVRAGPLDPPGGPITPTGHTLDELYNRTARTDAGVAEPRIPVQSLPGSATAVHVISQPGSYYLTGDVQGVAGKSAIVIASDRVQIDLCGYALVGAAKVLAALRTDAPQTALAVRGGLISGWSNLSVSFGNSVGCTLENIVFKDCNAYAGGSGGTVALGNDGAVRRCTLLRCLGSTVGLSTRGIMEDCYNVQGDGGLFFAFGDVVVRRNTFYSNNGGLLVQGAGVVEHNVAIDTASFRSEGDSVVAHNVLDRIRGGVGILLAGARVRCQSNRVSNVSVGILASAALSGWRDHHIEANLVQACGTGIRVEAAQACFLTGNRAKNCGVAFDIAPGNSHGPIVNVAGVGDISAVPNANHPWANFVY